MATAAEYAGGEGLPGIPIGATVTVTTADRENGEHLALRDATFLAAGPYGVGLAAPSGGGVVFLPWAHVVAIGIKSEGDDNGTT